VVRPRCYCKKESRVCPANRKAAWDGSQRCGFGQRGKGRGQDADSAERVTISAAGAGGFAVLAWRAACQWSGSRLPRCPPGVLGKRVSTSCRDAHGRGPGGRRRNSPTIVVCRSGPSGITSKGSAIPCFRPPRSWRVPSGSPSTCSVLWRYQRQLTANRLFLQAALRQKRAGRRRSASRGGGRHGDRGADDDRTPSR
jgi:hypothetical protein